VILCGFALLLCAEIVGDNSQNNNFASAGDGIKNILGLYDEVQVNEIKLSEFRKALVAVFRRAPEVVLLLFVCLS